ncbi:MAG: hypothetical protein WCO84_00645 [bacterium]
MKNRAQKMKPGDISLGMAHEFMISFGKQGGNYRMLLEAKDDEKLMDELVRYWKLRGYVPSEEHLTAQRIMGKNFIGVEEWLRFDVVTTKKAFDFINNIPFDVNTLKKYKDSHRLIAVPEISVAKMQKTICEFIGHNESFSFHRWEDVEWVNDKGNAGWHLVKKFPLMENEVLNQDHIEAEVRIVTYAMSTFCLMTSNVLCETFVKCREDNGREHFGVELTLGRGIELGLVWDHTRSIFEIAEKTCV